MLSPLHQFLYTPLTFDRCVGLIFSLVEHPRVDGEGEVLLQYVVYFLYVEYLYKHRPPPSRLKSVHIAPSDTPETWSTSVGFK